MDAEHHIKKTLREVFPDLLEEIGSCKTQEEKDEVLKKHLLKQTNNLKSLLSEDEIGTETTSGSKGDIFHALPLPIELPFLASFLLAPATQKNLVNAQGNAIKDEILYILARLMIVAAGEDEKGKVKAGKVASMVYYAGLLALGEKAINAVIHSMQGGAEEKEAVLFGVEAAGVQEIYSLASNIAFSVIPSISYTLSNSGFLLLINDLGDDLTFVDEWSISKINQQFTPRIPGSTNFLSYNRHDSAGFIFVESDIPATEPIEIGVKYGVTYKSRNHTFQLAFEIPANGIKFDNNCYCAIDSTSEQAAKETSIKNKQAYNVTTDDGFINVDIKVNSGSGRNAFFIARISEMIVYGK